MANVFIKELFKHLDQTVTIKGWVYNWRSSGKIAFLQIRDGSGFCQAVVSQPVPKITIETSVILTGKVSKHPKKEEYELQVEDLKVGQIAEDYPIGKKEPGPVFLKSDIFLKSPPLLNLQPAVHIPL